MWMENLGMAKCHNMRANVLETVETKAGHGKNHSPSHQVETL